MSPLSAERIMDPTITVKEKVAAWLANQGVSTVLLFCLLFKAGDLTDHLEKGYVRNAESLHAVALEHDKTIERLISQWREDRRLLIDSLRGKSVAEIRSDDSAINN